MSDEQYRSSPAQYPPEAPAAPQQPSTAPDRPPTAFDIGEEFGTARKNLPPAKIVLIAVAAIAVVAAVVSLVQRPQSSTTGSIDNVVVVPVPNQNQVMVAIGLSIHNRSQKPYTIHTIKADLEAGGSQFSDEPASAVDFDRYFQAFPALQRQALAPLLAETTIAPNGQTAGTIIVSFPLGADAFTNRKSLTVTISPYDQPVPLVLRK